VKRAHAKRKVFGIVLGLVGTAFLILYGNIGNVCGLGNFLVNTYFLWILPDYRQEMDDTQWVKWIYCSVLLWFCLLAGPISICELELWFQWIFAGKIGFVVVFKLPDVFVVAFDESKTNHSCCFLFVQPLFATILVSLGKDN
jgi:drug/metabolite transporter (DMT)-like permease